MENNFNEQDSLRLINEMIVQAKNNFQKGAGNSIIFWGYAIAVLSLVVFFLLEFKVLSNPANANWVWALTVPLLIVSFLYDRKKEKKAIVKTHLDIIIRNAWIAFFLSQMIFIPSIFILAIGLKSYVPYMLITPVILIMTGLCLLMTSVVSKYKPFMYGAFLFWIGALLCVILLVYAHLWTANYLIQAVCMIFGFCLPGHILNKKAESDV